MIWIDIAKKKTSVADRVQTRTTPIIEHEFCENKKIKRESNRQKWMCVQLLV